MNMLMFTASWGNNIPCVLEVDNYSYGDGIALQMYSQEDYGFFEPYATLTVNLEDYAKEGCAYLDTNNVPEVEGLFHKYNLGTPTGRKTQSGFCT